MCLKLLGVAKQLRGCVAVKLKYFYNNNVSNDAVRNELKQNYHLTAAPLGFTELHTERQAFSLLFSCPARNLTVLVYSVLMVSFTTTAGS